MPDIYISKKTPKISDQNSNIVEKFSKHRFNELPSHKINIKIDVKTWASLKNFKKENETFNDVICKLLKERTMSIEGKNAKAIKYARKTIFVEIPYAQKNNDAENVGVEFEYNDVKGEQTDFVLDIKFKKIFFRRKAMNPSFFFGVDSVHKHFNLEYFFMYFWCIYLVLSKEFRVNFDFLKRSLIDLAYWKKLYNDYSLSENSFANDIEEPLRLSEDEKPSREISINIQKSPSQKLIIK